MAQTSVAQYAADLKMSTSVLLEQLHKAGIDKTREDDVLSDQDKSRLLEFLRFSDGGSGSRVKITLTRKETSEIKSQDSQGKSRTVQVEVRKKRVLVKRETPEMPLALEEVKANPVEVIDASAPEAIITQPVEEPVVMVEATPVVAPIPEPVPAPVIPEPEPIAPEPEVIIPEPVIEVPVSKDIASKEEDKPVSSVPPVEKPAKAKQKNKNAEHVTPAPEAGPEAGSATTDDTPPQKVVRKMTRASIIGEEQRRLRAEEERRQAELRARQEAEYLEKQQRIVELARLKQEAEEAKVEAARVALAARQVAAQATNSKPTEEKPAKKVQPKPASGEKKPAEKKPQWKNEGAGKRGGLKTRGAVGATTSEWHDSSKHFKKGYRSQEASPAHGFQAPTEAVIHDVQIPETISVADLAHKMAVKATEVIKTMMKMGSMVTINQVLDQETAMIVVEEMGHRAFAAKLDDPDAFLEDAEHKDAPRLPRAPVVTVMGHVDHGKTSLLDYIRRTRVASGEAGGITQHIGAYSVKTSRGMVTFLDTPGHEAFTAMRARGAQATDIVILVVAADDGVMPQTREAISHAKAAGVPIVVAVNKIDKPEANPDRIKQELVAEQVIPEEYGGDAPFVLVSAKKGTGIDELLENVLLQAEVLELTTPADTPAKGLIIEARLDKGRGPVATMLVQSGTLRQGDILLAGPVYGRIRAMLDEDGKNIKEAGPSTPVEVLGLSDVPQAGQTAIVLADERKAREIALFRQGKFRDVKLAKKQAANLESILDQMGESDVKTLSLIIKSDVQGSQEALVHSLQKLSTDEVKINIIHAAVGGISESDVYLAQASDAVIMGFNTRADAGARKAAENVGVDIRYYNIIYDAVDEIKAALTGMLSPEKREDITGLVDIRQVFRASKIGTIAGCYVLEGIIKRSSRARLLRDNVVIWEGELDSLKRFKEDVKEVRAGFECGISLKNYTNYKEGDQIEVFDVTEVAREL